MAGAGKVDPRFHDRIKTGRNLGSSGGGSAVDPRFNKEKARRMLRASVVSELQEPEQKEKEPEIQPAVDLEINETLDEPTESEESDAHYPDL